MRRYDEVSEQRALRIYVSTLIVLNMTYESPGFAGFLASNFSPMKIDWSIPQSSTTQFTLAVY